MMSVNSGGGYTLQCIDLYGESKNIKLLHLLLVWFVVTPTSSYH